MFGFIGRLLGFQSYRDKTTALVASTQETIYNGLLAFLTFTSLIWMAVFFYATFYYTYLPAVSHVRPVHLQFRVCGRGESQTLCSFPSANVTLTRKEQFLAVGQPYRIGVELEMPESSVNQRLGMFMVCGHINDKDGIPISKSCRSAMMTYKSPLLQTISTFLLSPFFLTGSFEERQNLEVELFSNFLEQRLSPATDAYIQVQSHKIEIYRASLKIVAHFTGLRYFMFHWPILSAITGTLINLFFLTIIAFLSWYKYFTAGQMVYQIVGYDDAKAKNLEENRSAKNKNKEKREPSPAIPEPEQKTNDEEKKSVRKNKDDLETFDSSQPPLDVSHADSLENDSDSNKISTENANFQSNLDDFEILKFKKETQSDTDESESDTDISEDKENRLDFSSSSETNVRQRISRN